MRVPRGLVVALRDVGLDVASAASAAGIEPARLDEREPTLETAELAALLHAVFAPPRDSIFGLLVGEHVKPELFGVVGLVTLSAPTYGAALARCARYKRLLTDLTIDVERTPARARARVDVGGPDCAAKQGRIHTELAFLAFFGRRAAERSITPLTIRLRCEAPRASAWREREQALGCSLRFGQDADELILRAADLDVPLLSASPDVHAMLEAAAEQHLNELRDDLVVRARAAIEALLPEGLPEIAHVARRLRTSARTLQRRLKAEGTSFTSLVDDTRRALAVRHLESGRFGHAEVSFLLGFSHLNSFYRAFRRWTGLTPSEYVSASTSA